MKNIVKQKNNNMINKKYNKSTIKLIKNTIKIHNNHLKYNKININFNKLIQVKLNRNAKLHVLTAVCVGVRAVRPDPDTRQSAVGRRRVNPGLGTDLRISRPVAASEVVFSCIFVYF